MRLVSSEVGLPDLEAAVEELVAASVSRVEAVHLEDRCKRDNERWMEMVDKTKVLSRGSSSRHASPALVAAELGKRAAGRNLVEARKVLSDAVTRVESARQAYRELVSKLAVVVR